MSKLGKVLTPPGQFSLPIHGTLAGALDKAAGLLSVRIRKSPYKRNELVDLLSRLLGREIAETTLYAWTAETNRNRMPADVLVALCMTLDYYEPLNVLLTHAGRTVANAHDAALSELGRIQIERESLEQREQAARRSLNHNRGNR